MAPTPPSKREMEVPQPEWYRLVRSGHSKLLQPESLQISQVAGATGTSYNVAPRTFSRPVAGSNPAGCASECLWKTLRKMEAALDAPKSCGSGRAAILAALVVDEG
jgi:hypothetical protein